MQAGRAVRSTATHLPFYSHFSIGISSWPLSKSRTRVVQIFDLIRCDQCDPPIFILHLLPLASKIRIMDMEFLFFITNFWRTKRLMWLFFMSPENLLGTSAHWGCQHKGKGERNTVSPHLVRKQVLHLTSDLLDPHRRVLKHAAFEETAAKDFATSKTHFNSIVISLLFGIRKTKRGIKEKVPGKCLL